MCACDQITLFRTEFFILYVKNLDLFKKMCALLFLKMGYPDQTVVFQTPDRICYDYGHSYGSEKNSKVFFCEI